MISMYAEYSGRTLYVCLSTDNNADDFKGAKNGDTMYHMDTGKRYVYNDVDKAFHELPEEGGGGGTTPKRQITFKNSRVAGSASNKRVSLVGVYRTETDEVMATINLKANAEVTAYLPQSTTGQTAGGTPILLAIVTSGSSPEVLTDSVGVYRTGSTALSGMTTSAKATVIMLTSGIDPVYINFGDGS